MALLDNLIAIGILIGLGLIIYLKWTKKSIPDLYRDIREIREEMETE